MATLSQVARERKDALRALRKLSISLDAAQEAVDRELVRLINRKKAVPESGDLEKVGALLANMNSRYNILLKGVQDVGRAFMLN